MLRPRPTAKNLGMQTESLDSSRILTDADLQTQVEKRLLRGAIANLGARGHGRYLGELPRSIKRPAANLCSRRTEEGEENQRVVEVIARSPKAPESCLREKGQYNLSNISRRKDPLKSPGMRYTGILGQDLGFAGVGLQKGIHPRRPRESIYTIHAVCNLKKIGQEVEVASISNRLWINPELEGNLSQASNQSFIIQYGY